MLRSLSRSVALGQCSVPGFTGRAGWQPRAALLPLSLIHLPYWGCLRKRALARGAGHRCVPREEAGTAQALVAGTQLPARSPSGTKGQDVASVAQG